MPRRSPSPSSPTLATKSTGTAVTIPTSWKAAAKAQRAASPEPLSLMPGPRSRACSRWITSGGGGGKDGIEMSADGDGWGVGMRPGAGGEQVAYGVRGSGEAEELETLAEPGGARLLGKGRRRNRGDGELEVGNFTLVAGKPLKEAVDAWIGSKATEILGERSGLSRLGLPSNPGTKWHFRNDGTREGVWKWVA